MDVKKGKRSWKPADALAVKPGHVLDGFKPRWVDSDPQNIQKKLSEGWRFSKKEQEQTDDSGKPLTSTTKHRELVLMEIAEEDLAARTEYFQSKTDQQTIGLKREAEKEAGQKLDGTIIIE